MECRLSLLKCPSTTCKGTGKANNVKVFCFALAEIQLDLKEHRLMWERALCHCLEEVCSSLLTLAENIGVLVLSLCKDIQ